ncbi:hypothetical protein MRX96_050413 [Rhipicephalus microplus]
MWQPFIIRPGRCSARHGPDETVPGVGFVSRPRSLLSFSSCKVVQPRQRICDSELLSQDSGNVYTGVEEGPRHWLLGKYVEWGKGGGAGKWCEDVRVFCRQEERTRASVECPLTCGALEPQAPESVRHGPRELPRSAFTENDEQTWRHRGGTVTELGRTSVAAGVGPVFLVITVNRSQLGQATQNRACRT